MVSIVALAGGPFHEQRNNLDSGDDVLNNE